MTLTASAQMEESMNTPVVNVTLDFSGRDATAISNFYLWHSGLARLSLYARAPDELRLDKVKTHIDNLQQAFEGGATGNHSLIALRKRLRKEVTNLFRRILCFIQCLATEADIPSLIDAGFSVQRRIARKKVVVAPS